MEITTKIKITPTETPPRREERFPIQELVANPVTYRFERPFAEILSERAADIGAISTAPVFIP
ncbi:MAG: hypothetical protein A2X25_14260 [Chloroflexi bacterium GWB2_49_20]|nr:MAG: hypothetical protein A2X25_14260 [Chloroflexi bacterium GWB2_49_20]OGN79863.1 MAG: hypothetical protein A2X26_02490 [Chloroflexi bacterium GWC2_49_37]OGN85602.1 MAG: hypothetical protein A2X27_04570 [Chloroflexi bacterium GWD2_49_16]HBG74480.1 hypothetical protein [Anaerolineae bacterium]HCC79647.1 hypothetical protein [Anaerolineae bacterium]